MFPHAFHAQSDGSINLELGGSQTSEMQILPPQSGLKHPAGSCGSDGQQFCSKPWPKDVLGAIPRSPPEISQIDPAPKGAHELTKCGSFCRRPQECGSRGTVPKSERCFCAEPSPRDARMLGLDPVAPTTVCLALGITMMAGSLVGRGEMGGIDQMDSRGMNVLLQRDMPNGIAEESLFRDAEKGQYLDERGVEYRCLCNETFTSPLCCDSRDGMVWLGD